MESECCISCNKVVRTRQYINLPDKSWVTRHHTWYHRLSRICFIKYAILANKIWNVLVKYFLFWKKVGLIWPSLKYDEGWDVMILHVPVYDKRPSEDEKGGVEWWGWGEWTAGAPNRETHSFFLFKRINMWYHDAFHYFLSIYVRFGQFTFGPVNMYSGQ